MICLKKGFLKTSSNSFSGNNTDNFQQLVSFKNPLITKPTTSSSIMTQYVTEKMRKSFLSSYVQEYKWFRSNFKLVIQYFYQHFLISKCLLKKRIKKNYKNIQDHFFFTKNIHPNTLYSKVKYLYKPHS